MSGSRRAARARCRPVLAAETGLGSVLALMAVACLLAAACTGWGVLAAATARHRAAGAADLAALAGALHPGPQACGAAGGVAAENAATLVACEVGQDAVVTVLVSVDVPLLGATVHARERAVR